MLNIPVSRNDFTHLPLVRPEHMAGIAHSIGICDRVTGAPDVPTIKTVLAVGGIYDHVTGLRGRDEALLRQAVSSAIDLGFNVEALPEIRTADLHNGHDYHSGAAYEAHLVVLCYIPKSGDSNPQKADPYLLISGQGNTPRQWRDSIAKRRPMMAVSAKCDEVLWEITVRKSRPRNYVEIVPQCFDAPPHRFREASNFTMHGIVRKDIARQLSNMRPRRLIF